MSDADRRAVDAPLSRRSALKVLGGGAALALFPSALAACSSSSKTSSNPASGGSATTAAGALTGKVTFGSNYSDAVPKAAFASMIGGFTAAHPSVTVNINTVDHNTFQNNINNYLQGTPDDLFTWFAGYRMRFFASQGLAEPIDDVWDVISPHFSDAFKAASKGDDGHYYFVPLYNYPWAVFYRKSVWQQHGYQVPTTWDAFVSLQKQMQKDGLVPMAMGQKDGWPALG
ncbi:MAG TPA: ABC transporter substrate-binding protein, partial [Acidimicrobiales bacterium]|nr:ABC transporter substrate-binding protein [Acidimicrobiales bacterium]